MKKLILPILLFLFTYSFGQMTREETMNVFLKPKTIEDLRVMYPKACYFYESINDYNSNKAVDGLELKLYSYKGGNNIVVFRNGVEEKAKISELAQYFICNEQGMLMRIVENDLFIIVARGVLCYYVQYGYGRATKLSDGSYYFSPNADDKFFDKCSDGIEGEIKDFKDSKLIDLLKANDLYEEYEADKIKREMKDSVWGYRNKVLSKRVKFIKLLNKKLKG
jgi:hypothetical protein